MNILIIGSGKPNKAITVYDKSHFKKIKSILPDAKITLTDDAQTVSRLLPKTNIIITSPFMQHMLDFDKAKNLKWVHFSSAGVTDIAKALKGYDILLTNSSGVHPIPISEHVFAMLLMFARQLTRSYLTQKIKKHWDRDVEGLPVFELYGKTLGIVGLGRIGSQIAHLGKGFGMNVVALSHRKNIKNKDIDKVYTKVDDLLKNSDFVVNALPLTDETKGYFDINKFKKMRRTAYFVNIGRGKTVVEKDLIQALKNGLIAGAGLDVLDEEPTPDSNPLWKLDNVIITPHYSGWTPEYTNRVIDIFCENLKGYLKGGKMPNLVDKNKGY